MDWWKVVETLQNYIVKILTPYGSGSGFLVSYSFQSDVCAIATAAHVVSHSDWWEQPIRLYHPVSGKFLVLRQGDRAIHFHHKLDTAAILFNRGDFPLPDHPIELKPEGNILLVGNEVCWLGFPAVSSAPLCFFTGKISAWLPKTRSYLVDGVAINGVSGAPAIVLFDDNSTNLIGVVTAYIPNRATGEALPGLSVIQDVAQFHEIAKDFETLDKAAIHAKDNPPPAPTPEPPDESDIANSAKF